MRAPRSRVVRTRMRVNTGLRGRCLIPLGQLDSHRTFSLHLLPERDTSRPPAPAEAIPAGRRAISPACAWREAAVTEHTYTDLSDDELDNIAIALDSLDDLQHCIK